MTIDRGMDDGTRWLSTTLYQMGAVDTAAAAAQRRYMDAVVHHDRTADVLREQGCIVLAAETRWLAKIAYRAWMAEAENPEPPDPTEVDL